MFRPRIALLAVAATAAMLGLPSSFAGPAPAAAVEHACAADVFLVFARGSGQNGADHPQKEMNAFLGGVRSHTPEGLRIAERKLGLEGKYKGEHYRAVPAIWGLVPGPVYGNSVQDGIDELRLVLQDRAKDCKDELWILGGYSQGAQVVGTVLEKMTADERTQIGYVALFGDPKLVTDDDSDCANGQGWWVRGTVGCGQRGIFTRGVSSRRAVYVPADLRGKFGSWCDHRDGVCAAGALYLKDPSHFAYSESMIGEASLEAVFAVHTRLANPAPIQSLDLARGNAGTDLMVVFDTTGSMFDEIDDMRANAQSIANRVQSKPNGRIGLVQFRDHGDEFVTRMETDLTSDAAVFSAALGRLVADGGGDYEEAQYSGIARAINDASWRYGSTKSLVVITDAPGKDPEPVTGLTRSAIVKLALAPPTRAPDGPLTPPNLAELHQTLPVASTADGQAVGIFGVNVCSCSEPGEFLAPLAADTGGAVLRSAGDLNTAFADVIQRAAARPIVRIPSVHYAPPGRPVLFSAEGSFDPDSRIVGYRWDLDGDGTFETATDVPSTSRAYDVSLEIRVGVAAVSADGGVGTASTRLVVRPNVLASLRPGPVREVKARRAGARKVRLSWKAPISGVVPAGYLILDARGRTVKVVRAPTRATTIRGLARGARHRFSVVASGIDGEGPKRTAKPVFLPAAKRGR